MTNTSLLFHYEDGAGVATPTRITFLELDVGEDHIDRIKESLKPYAQGGDTRIRFRVPGSTKPIRAGKEWSVVFSPELLVKLQRILGRGAVRAVVQFPHEEH